MSAADPLRLSLAFAAAAALLLAPASPALAAPGGNATELRNCLLDCASPAEIVLTDDLNTGTDVLEVDVQSVTVDLAGHRLDASGIRLSEGTDLTITDSGSGGVLESRAGTAGGPGIETTGATLRIAAGQVIAAGRKAGDPYTGPTGAGIGGAYGKVGGALFVTGGQVHAEGAHQSAGIGNGAVWSGPSGPVTISGGEVLAFGGDQAAGIGGGNWSGPGALSISGGVVQAQGGAYGAGIGGGYDGAAGGPVTISGGEVTAAGGWMAAGIGSTRYSVERPGADVTIGSGASVTAIGNGRTAVGVDARDDLSADFGKITIGGDLFLPSGSVQIADSDPANAEITVTPTGRILGSASSPTSGAQIQGHGQLDNRGVIALEAEQVDVEVQGHSYRVDFDTQGRGGDSSEHLFARDFATGYRSFPSPPAGTLWNTRSDGTGAAFEVNSSVDENTTLFAAPPASIDTSAIPTLGRIGTPLALDGTRVVDPAGSDLNAELTWTSDVAEDLIEDGMLTPATIGPRELTATAVIRDATVTATVTVDIAAEAPDAPTELRAVSGDSETSLSWNAPLEAGEAIISYIVEHRTGGGDWAQAASVDETHATLTDLQNGSVYQYRVAAVDRAGPGPFSEVVTTTPYSFDPSFTSDGIALIDGSRLAPGANLTMSASKLPVGAHIVVSLQSVQHEIASGTVAEDGTVTVVGSIPADAAEGDETIVAALTLSEGSAEATADLAIQIRTTTISGPADRASDRLGEFWGAGGREGGLAATGAALSWPRSAAIASLLLVFGSALVLANRRRGGRQQS